MTTGRWILICTWYISFPMRKCLSGPWHYVVATLMSCSQSNNHSPQSVPELPRLAKYVNSSLRECNPGHPHCVLPALRNIVGYLAAASFCYGKKPLADLCCQQFHIDTFPQICWYLAAVVQIQLCKYFIEISDTARESTVWGEINVLRYVVGTYPYVAVVR